MDIDCSYYWKIGDRMNESILARYADNLTLQTYITNPAVAREKRLRNLSWCY